ncbi:hypothetical protein [Novosphingobium album (ex Liu et al. 2023)]|uniref:DUF2285 domain-containing protein n=1 Tax=Novosphingobium album (ex Liu et al. 2023) TaxID=3031130 RepID=A0ABT5WMW7_9SPHN|nr:hypothetical protein [Novosphingobium album (ex Liu et al. 2023)]MDE8651397.1 hypothetical protein [Novosphingobium album (ex Liu et al. 2023)]
MTIRFAPARKRGHPAIAHTGGPSRRRRAANDNGPDSSHHLLLEAALRHFAGHGLAAAEHARDNADAARNAGDDLQCAWWLAICRTLDRRMADAYARRIAGTKA